MSANKFQTRLLLATAALALSACGLQGDLKRPDPLWGDPPLDGPTDPRVIRQLEEEERIRAEQEAAAEEAARRAEIDAAAEEDEEDSN